MDGKPALAAAPQDPQQQQQKSGGPNEKEDRDEPAQATPPKESDHEYLDDTYEPVFTDDESESEDEEDNDSPGTVNQFAKRGMPSNRTTAAKGDGQEVKIHDTHEEEELPTISGWAEKSSPAYFIPLQWRYVELMDRQLRWFKSDDPEAPVMGHLDMDLINVEIKRHYGEHATPSRTRTCCCGRKAGSVSELILGGGPRASFTITPVGSKRVFELSLPTEAEAEAWVSCLELHEKRSKKLSGGGTTVKLDNWWRFSRMSPEKFESIAQTGDVLLFKSKGNMPRLIRVASGGGARYDHTGLIVKLSDGKVAILEATGNEGVGLVTWQEFVENHWYALYPEMALRRVFFPRSKERLKKLQVFINDTLGKPYGLSVSKLMARTSVHNPVGEEAYFCSQLCAKALKVLGVLPEEKASTSYWPATFSARSPPIECEKHCRFDRTDIIIDFSLGDPARFPKDGLAGGKQRDATTNWG